MFNFDPIRILLTLPGIVIGFAFHEFAHAYMADRLGDPTPRSQGRLTLSPLSHLDIVGTIFIILVGFGWAKPVETNPRYYRNPKRDDLLVSLAGPAANLVIAFAFALCLKFFLSTGAALSTGGSVAVYTAALLQYTIHINIVLCIFNLLPIPPLDGFHILADLIPPRNYKIIYTLQQYSNIILIVLILTRITYYVVGIPAAYVYNAITRIVGM